MDLLVSPPVFPSTLGHRLHRRHPHTSLLFHQTIFQTRRLAFSDATPFSPDVASCFHGWSVCRRRFTPRLTLLCPDDNDDDDVHYRLCKTCIRPMTWSYYFVDLMHTPPFFFQ